MGVMNGGLAVLSWNENTDVLYPVKSQSLFWSVSGGV